VLVEGRADVHASSNKGFTPLMFAAKNGDIEMAKLLIGAGVDVNETGIDNTHVLPYAIINSQAEFAKFLLEQGADANGQMEGVRALHTAAGNTDTWLNEWYRRHGSIGLSGFGFNSAQRLTPAMRTDLVKALVAKGADVNARIEVSAMLMNYIGYPKKGAFEPFACGTGDLLGATPLWVAAYTANGGTRPNAAAAGPEADASRMGSPADVIKALLDAGADQKIPTVDGTTPFMVAAGLGRATFTPGQKRAARAVGAEEAVKVLFEAGAEINRVNEADFTALHGAAMRGLNEVIAYLVEHGADINARDFRGRTAYRLAEGSKQSFQFQAWPETAEYLKSLGANTRLGLAGTVQERLRDISATGQQE
jgi:ankyrin repeat protein